MQYDPLVALELAERYLLALVASEGEVRGFGSDFDHGILPCVSVRSIQAKMLGADILGERFLPFQTIRRLWSRLFNPKKMGHFHFALTRGFGTVCSYKLHRNR